MQSVSSRIWTRVTVSISYDDNHYTTGTSTQAQLIYGNSLSENECTLQEIPALSICVRFLLV